MERASADVGLMFTAYNLRRLINIIGQENFKEYLKKVLFAVFSSYKSLWCSIMKLHWSEPEYRNYFPGSKNAIFKPVFTGYFLEKPGIVRGL
jgi:hypothetical protein